ncbi:MAG: hypothetical protein HY665_04750, partial [Chloroflexi bacterium]|nr:hypothetical protein [Chloroflexota bacterium]
MDKVNVVVTANIPADFLRVVQAADPRVKITAAGPLFRAEREVEEGGGKATPEQAAALKELDKV